MTAPIELGELWRRFKVEGDLEARQAIVTHYQSLVRMLVGALRTRHPTADREELISAGTVGMMEAIDRFEVGRGLQFNTYATARIRGAVLDALRRLGTSTRGQRVVWRQLEAAVTRVEQRSGKRAEPAKVAAELRLPPTDYWRLRDSLGPVAVAMPPEVEHPGSPAALPIDELIEEEARVAVREQVRRLPRRQREAITWYYFRSMRLREIGTSLGVSESRVSQILRDARERIRRQLEPHR
jgi:RNA polymerase sigma factor for flagellar operon FliA